MKTILSALKIYGTNDSIFARERVNLSHRPELDFFKFFAICLMIIAHTGEVLFSQEWEDYYFVNLTLHWCIITGLINMCIAPGFMFTMGTTLSYSRHDDSSFYLSRAWHLILGWFIINAIRTPLLAPKFGPAIEVSPWYFYISFLFTCDILMLAGLFFLFLGLLKKMKVSYKGTFLAALLIFCISHFVRLETASILLHNILGIFICTEYSGFPVLNWLIVPVIGLGVGKLLVRCRNLDWFYSILGIIGLSGLSVMLYYLYLHQAFTPENMELISDLSTFYHLDIYALSCTISAYFFLLSCSYFIMKVAQFARFRKMIGFFSKNLTVIYFIQWTIIPCVAFFTPLPTHKYSSCQVIATGLIFILASSLLALLYSTWFKGKIMQRCNNNT